MPTALKTQIVAAVTSRAIPAARAAARNAGERRAGAGADQPGRDRRRQARPRLHRRLPVDGLARLPDPEVERTDHVATSTLDAAGSCAPRRSSPARSARPARRSRSTSPASARRSPRRRPTTRPSSACSSTAATTRRTWCCAPTRRRSPSTRGCGTPARTRSRCSRRARAPNGGATRASPARLGGVLPIAPKFTVSTENARQHLRAASEHARGAEPVRRGPARDPRQRRPAGRAADAAPSTRSNSKPRPQALGSHNDQQSTWQALGPEGVKIGWGGHLGDMVASSNANTVFTSISVSGNAVFSAGETTFQYQVGNGGAAADRRHHRHALRLGDRGDDAALDHHRRQRAPVREGVQRRSSTARSTPRRRSRPPSPPSTVAAPTQYVQPSTGNQRRPTAWRSSCRPWPASSARASALGAKRQVFFVSIGGFDTHDGQNPNQADLLARISHALGYFDTALAERRRRRHAQQRHRSSPPPTSAARSRPTATAPTTAGAPTTS